MAGSIKNTSVFIVDSSFLLSILLPDEEVLDERKELIRGFRTHKVGFWSCDLLKYEIYNSLRSAIRQKRITKKRAGILSEAFKLMQIKYLDVDFEETLGLSLEYNLSFYDASYLYLAKIHKCDLLTLDDNLVKLQN